MQNHLELVKRIFSQTNRMQVGSIMLDDVWTLCSQIDQHFELFFDICVMSSEATTVLFVYPTHLESIFRLDRSADWNQLLSLVHLEREHTLGPLHSNTPQVQPAASSAAGVSFRA